MNLILSLLRARFSMIFDARNSSRRCTSVTLLANRVRKRASSIAESPPPMTAMCWSRKKNPSQVAQQRLLAGNLEIACRGAHCQDDGPGAVGVSVRGHDRLDRSLQRN